jgi:hypothetical protein
VLLEVARGKVRGFLDRQSEEAWDDVGIVAKFNMWRRGSVPVAKCFKKLGDRNPMRGAQPIQMHPLIHTVFGIMMLFSKDLPPSQVAANTPQPSNRASSQPDGPSACGRGKGPATPSNVLLRSTDAVRRLSPANQLHV